MLTQSERDYVFDQLVAVLVGSGSERPNITAALPFQLLLQLPADGLLPSVLVAKALSLCEDDGYDDKPARTCFPEREGIEPAC